MGIWRPRMETRALTRRNVLVQGFSVSVVPWFFSVHSQQTPVCESMISRAMV